MNPAEGVPGGIAELDPVAELEDTAASAEYTPPNPTRKNPFEFGSEMAGLSLEGSVKTDAASIRLYGFAGESPVKAIVHANGATKLMSEGESWGMIELLEIDPPQAKIRVDGVTRSWSLLGQVPVPDDMP